MNSTLNLFPLLAVSWLLGLALTIFLIRLFRVKFPYFWLLSTFGILVAWVLVLLSRSGLPYIQEPASLLPSITENIGLPSLLVDGISWPYALVFISISMVVYLTFIMEASQMDWLSLGGGLALTAFGLIAIQSRDAVTIQSSWAAIDIVEFSLLFLRLRDRGRIDYLITALAFRIMGIILFLWGTSDTTLLFFSAILRSVVIPAAFMDEKELNLPRCMINLFSFASPLSSFIVIARIAVTSVGSDINSLLYIALLGIGLIAGLAWFNARNGFEGRGYWVVALSTFVILAAMRGLLIASISWGIAIALSGGILFFEEKIFRKPVFLFMGVLAITSIPFSPTWDGASLYTSSPGISLVFFVLIQSLMVGGYIRHIILYRSPVATSERWVLLIQPLRLIIILCVYWLIAYLYWRDGVLLRNSLPWFLPKNSLDYFIGFIIGLVSLAMYYIWKIRDRLPGWFKLPIFQKTPTAWIVKSGNYVYQLAVNVIGGLSSIVEGEGGILLTLLLLALLVTFFIQGQ